MKAFRFFTAILLLLAVLTAAVSASDFVDSKELGEGPEQVGEPDETGKKVVGYIYNEDGSLYRSIYEDELIVTPIMHVYSDEISVAAEIEKTLLDAKAELDANSWEKLIPSFPAVWENVTGGAPLEHAVLTELFDVRFVDSLSGVLTEGRSATFCIKVEGLEKDDLFVMMHKPSDSDAWKFEDWTMNDENVITVHVDKLSPFAIVEDSEQDPAGSGDAPDSPKTGVQTGAYLLPILGCALIALGAAYGIRRSAKHAA